MSDQRNMPSQQKSDADKKAEKLKAKRTELVPKLMNPETRNPAFEKLQKETGMTPLM